MRDSDVKASFLYLVIFFLLLVGRGASGFKSTIASAWCSRHKGRPPIPTSPRSIIRSSSININGKVQTCLYASSLAEDTELVGDFDAPDNDNAKDDSLLHKQQEPKSRGDNYLDRFGGIGRLYNDAQGSFQDVLKRMRQATVVVVGIGGVGSWAAEALCRSGVGNIVLVDLDDICVSNINRQLHATTAGVGQMKVDVMKQRLLDIYPDCNVTLVYDFVSEENAKQMLQGIGSVTAVIDAIDGASEKSALIGACADLAIPVVTCGGAAGRRDPFQIMCGDLVNVEDDRLLAGCRRILRKKYGFPAGLSFSQQRVTKKKMKKWRIPCVYTREAPPSKQPLNSDSASSTFRLCDGSFGTACFVTGSYGFAAASLCVDMIAQDKLVPPYRG